MLRCPANCDHSTETTAFIEILVRVSLPIDRHTDTSQFRHSDPAGPVSVPRPGAGSVFRHSTTVDEASCIVGGSWSGFQQQQNVSTDRYTTQGPSSEESSVCFPCYEACDALDHALTNVPAVIACPQITDPFSYRYCAVNHVEYVPAYNLVPEGFYIYSLTEYLTTLAKTTQ